MKYFEIEFSDHGDETSAYWICIKGIREPTISEANKFLEADSKMYGWPVWRVDPINDAEARGSYDFSDEANWPVFGI